MNITSRTRVSELLSNHPEAREILSWYDVDMDDADLRMDLGLLCACYELDFEDIQAELETYLSEDDGEHVRSSYDPDDYRDEDYDYDDYDDELSGTEYNNDD